MANVELHIIKRRHHVLKVHSSFYDDLAQGLKNFEMRLDDRDYQVDDILVLREINLPEDMKASYEIRPGQAGDVHRADVIFTGRVCMRRVTYILTHRMYTSLPQGFVIMALEPWDPLRQGAAK
jgi:hypothetical protein